MASKIAQIFDIKEKKLVLKSTLGVKKRKLLLEEFLSGFNGDFCISNQRYLFIWAFCIVEITEIKYVKVEKFDSDDSFFFTIVTNNSDIFNSRIYGKEKIVKW